MSNLSFASLNPTNILSAFFLNNFTANEKGDTFSVKETGVYLVGYHIKTCELTNMKVRIARNDTALSNSVCSSTMPLCDYNLSTIAQLNAGDTLQLQLYDLDNEKISLHDEMSSNFWLVRLF